MEGQQLPRAAAGALGIDAHAANAPLQVVRRLEDGLEGPAVVLPVDGQEARGVGDVPDEGDLHVGGLGDIGDVVLLQGHHAHQGVEHGPVVAHDQKGLPGQLLLPQDHRAQAAVIAEEPGDDPGAGDGPGELPLDGLVPVHPLAAEPDDQDQPGVEQQLRGQEQGQGPPEGKAAESGQAQGRRQRDQKKRESQVQANPHLCGLLPSHCTTRGGKRKE